MFVAARWARPVVRTLRFSMLPIHRVECPFRPEILMTQKLQHPPTTPVPGRPPLPTPPDLKTPPAEPLEVLGRHKNTGQKDHKGAR